MLYCYPTDNIETLKHNSQKLFFCIKPWIRLWTQIQPRTYKQKSFWRRTNCTIALWSVWTRTTNPWTREFGYTNLYWTQNHMKQNHQPTILALKKEPKPKINRKQKQRTNDYWLEKKTSVLKLNQPKPFTGKWTKFNDFLHDIELYLDINKDIYNTNKKKIGYALSFINKGDAKSWKGQFIWNAQGPTRLDFGTWMQYVKELTNAFQPYDAPRDALEHLTNMKMGSNTIKDHTAKFQTLLEKIRSIKEFSISNWLLLKNPKYSTPKKNPGTTSHAKKLEEWY